MPPKAAIVAGAAKKGVRMPICDYGAACTRKGCVYRHPPKTAAPPEAEEVCKPFLAGSCQFGSCCRNFHPPPDEVGAWCRKYATTACRYGEDCRNQSCLFWHPWSALDTATASAEKRVDSDGCSYTRQEFEDCYGGDWEAHWMAAAAYDPKILVFDGVSSNGTVPASKSNIADAREPSHPDAAAAASAASAAYIPCPETDEDLCHHVVGLVLDEFDDEIVVPRGFENLPLFPTGQQQNLPLFPTGQQQHSTAPAEWQPREPPPTLQWQQQDLPQYRYRTEYQPAPNSWAAVAVAAASGPGVAMPPSAGAASWTAPAHSAGAGAGTSALQYIRIPEVLWLPEVSRVDAPSAFRIQNPLARFEVVNAPHVQRAATHSLPLSLLTREAAGALGRAPTAKVLDLHYQSVRTVHTILEQMLPMSLASHAEVWLITGTGHHTAKHSHQRAQVGGVLRSAVEELLQQYEYEYYPGKDRAGHSGAFLVVARGQMSMR